jgi:hypothetical protein
MKNQGWMSLVAVLILMGAGVAADAQDSILRNSRLQNASDAQVSGLHKPDLVAERDGLKASLWFVTKQVRDQFFSLPSAGDRLIQGNGGRPDVAILELDNGQGRPVTTVASAELRLAIPGGKTWTTALFPTHNVYSGDFGQRDGGEYRMSVEFVLDGEPYSIQFPQALTIQ